MALKSKTKTFHGRPCRHGHGTFRYTVGGACIECVQQYRQKCAAQKRVERRIEREKSAPARAVRAKECQLRSNRLWAQNNRAVKNARSRAWNRANRFKRRAYKVARKAGLRQSAPKWLTKDHKTAIMQFYRKAQEFGLTVDHIIPLRGENVCGLHVPWNLQLLSRSENSSKGNSWAA